MMHLMRLSGDDNSKASIFNVLALLFLNCLQLALIGF
jgi:hypothetical protein